MRLADAHGYLEFAAVAGRDNDGELLVSDVRRGRNLVGVAHVDEYFILLARLGLDAQAGERRDELRVGWRGRRLQRLQERLEHRVGRGLHPTRMSTEQPAGGMATAARLRKMFARRRNTLACK